MSELFSHGYALLAGIGASAYPRWSLPVTVRDVRALKAILTDRALCAYPDDGDHVRLLHDASAMGSSILEGLAWLGVRAAADPEATVVVYYSGHGWLDRATDRYYLIPHDVEPLNIPGSALPARAFAEAVHRIPARRLLIFVDSCHAEGMAAARKAAAAGDEPAMELPKGFAPAALPKDLSADLKQGEGRAVFTSSRGDQRSWVRPDGALSLYTYHLVEALQGAGNRPGDRLVRVSNLMNHLGRTVPESARRLCGAEQTPFFDAATEDFPVAVLRGGKGLPAGGWQAVQDGAEETMRRLYQVVLGDVALAQGEGTQAASGRGVAGRQISGPVVIATGESKVQIGGGIQAGSIQARNVVSGVQVAGAPAGATADDLRGQVAALRQQAERAIAAGAIVSQADAQDMQAALGRAEEELGRPEPDGNRVARKLAEVAEILSASVA